MGLRSGIDVFYCFVSFVRLFDAHFWCFLGHTLGSIERETLGVPFLSLYLPFLFYISYINGLESLPLSCIVASSPDHGIFIYKLRTLWG